MHTNTTIIKQVGSNKGIPKSKPHIILEVLEYAKNTIARKTIIKHNGSSMSSVAFDKGELFCERTTLYETFLQVIDGKAELTIGKKEFNLTTGECIVIPKQSIYCLIANEEFKIIITHIKDND
jgi:quercetin dioxygenase-like cupin family protein